MSQEEREFMWNLGFVLALKHRLGVIRKSMFYNIRSFVTYRGIFMAPEFGLGDTSVWKWERFLFLRKFSRR